ncbi:hypothetical protein E6C60_0956 [Paenibacillus algicola]|uniref:Uncharacterized protein n=1 Tax=Paenibacillus algicola TaxID=2565926 RepID=A0A4P8XH46_9BACL|nr:hypothetical protein E6C60_0956 [Paenibacillus algicola]
MITILLGITSIISSVIVLCAGFIVSALRSVHYSAGINLGAFEYSLFNISFLWILIPILLFIIGVFLLYLSAKDAG